MEPAALAWSDPTARNDGNDGNDLAFLCLNTSLHCWEDLQVYNSAETVHVHSSVQAFQRLAADEGRAWKRSLAFLQPYGNVLMRDCMLHFACKQNLYAHLVSPRMLTGYVEAWLVYTNVDVLVQEVHARNDGMDAAAHAMLCEVAHDMYRQVMLQDVTGERKRAVWFYDTNSRKRQRKQRAALPWDARG